MTPRIAERREFGLATRPIMASRPAHVESMISKVLPPGVAYCDDPGNARDHTIHLDERQLADESRMPIDRRAAFRRGRSYARAAMAKLGRLDTPIPIGASKQPEWPSGLIGSITHCWDYSAAAVARTGDIRAIGIDAEGWQQFPVDIADEISVPWEIDNMAPTIDVRIKLSVLFSAKKSIFKALNPIVRRDFDFRAAALKIDFADRAFRMVSVDSPDLDEFRTIVAGTFSVTRQMVLTSAIVHS